MPTTGETRVLTTGLAIGESARWHDGRLWLCNWGTGEVLAVDTSGATEVMARVATTMPFSIDWLPDGRLLVVSGPERLLLRQETDGSLVTHGDLRPLSGGPFNEVVVDGQGGAYVNGAGFAPMSGQAPAPGGIALVAPDGAARWVAEGAEFPNGMALSADGSTLILAESYGRRLTAFDVGPDGGLSGRRVWAELGDGVPDGICVDAEGAVWYADVPNQRCVRVREGGEVLATVAADRGCFACMLGGTDGRTLFVLAARWHGMDRIDHSARDGLVLTAPAPAPHAGRP
jgi:sugar lactone lactonase YvrE